MSRQALPQESGTVGYRRVLRHHRVDMTRVAVKKRRMVHRRHNMCSRDPRRRSRRGRRRGGHRWWRCRRWRRHHRWRPRQGCCQQRRGYPRCHPWWRRDRPCPALVDVHRLGKARWGCNMHWLGAGCRRNGHRRPRARVRRSGRNHLEEHGHQTRARHGVRGRTGGRRARTRCRQRLRRSRTYRKQ